MRYVHVSYLFDNDECFSDEYLVFATSIKIDESFGDESLRLYGNYIDFFW